MSEGASGGVHPTAVVAGAARLGRDVTIGPYSVVGDSVELADNVWVGSHVNLQGVTQIGEGSRVFPFATVGSPPQDLKYKGEATKLEVGARTTIREHVSINPGTEAGGGVTRVGDDCLLMIGVHVAHDCQVGNGVIIANNSSLSGHTIVEDSAILGGHVGVHQQCRIGQLAMVGGMSGVYEDVVPFGQCSGMHATLDGLNLVGLRRRGLSNETIRSMQEALQFLFARDESLVVRARKLQATATVPEVVAMATFILAPSSRGFMHPNQQQEQPLE